MYLTQSLNPQHAALYQREQQRAAQARLAAQALVIVPSSASKEDPLQTVKLTARYAPQQYGRRRLRRALELGAWVVNGRRARLGPGAPAHHPIGQPARLRLVAESSRHVAHQNAAQSHHNSMPL
jgi:hypothetical protein